MHKIIKYLLWLTTGAGMVVLLLAAINKHNAEICAGVKTSVIANENHISFLSTAQIEKLVYDAADQSLIGKTIQEIQLAPIKAVLEKNDWIDEVNLFFDNRNVLHVQVKEKPPLARVFTTGGSSFFINNNLNKIEVTEGIAIKVPVFTGFRHTQNWSRADSLILKDVGNMASFIARDSFWNAQIAEVNIVATGFAPEMNLVPMIGNQLIYFGTATDMASKFNRLNVFYKDVLSKSNFKKYTTIDLRYNGQVVASDKAGGNLSADTLTTKKTDAKLSAERKKNETKTKEVKKTNTEAKNKTAAGGKKAETSKSGNRKTEKEKQPKAILKPKTKINNN